ncbi:MAG TPA: hypothetical protein VMH23_01280 [Bacteroidota bacterium]|nr:hypothetical protein [Bacteroidota bacterium]
MKQITSALIVTAAVVLGCSTARTQTSQKPTVASERPKIAFLAGTFSTVVSIPPSPPMPKGMSAKGTSTVGWILDSTFLSIDDQNSLFGRYKAHGVLGFDAQEGQFVLTMYNNFGDHPSYHGSFVGDTLVLLAKIPSPRGTFEQKLQWYKEGNAVKLKIQNDMGKGFMPVMEQVATRTN